MSSAPSTEAAPAEPKGATADAGTAVLAAVQRLAFALRVRRFYPSDSPVLTRKIEETRISLQDAARHGPLEIEIHPEEIGWSSADGEYRRVLEADLAGTLHRRCIARLRFEPGMGSTSLRALLDDLVSARDANVDDPGPLLAGEIPGVRAQRLELDALFASGPSRVSRQEIWNRVLAGFAEIQGVDIDSWSQVARDVRTLTRFLEWALTPESQPQDLRRYAQTDAFGLLCEQIASIAVEDPRNVFETLTQATAALFDKLDPEAWLEILADPLPLEVGDAAHADLTAAIGKSLSNEQARSLIRYALRTRSRATPRLYRFFDRVLRERPDRESLATSLIGQLQQTESATFAKAWPQFMKVMLGENIDPYVNADYRATLDEATGALTSDEPLWDRGMLRARKADMGADFTRIRRARIAFALLTREVDVNDYELLLRCVQETIPVMVERDNYELLEAIVSTLARHARDVLLPERHRQLASEALGQLRQPALIASLAQRLSIESSEQFHILWRIIDRLGPDCVPQLLEALATRSSPAYRTHLTRVLSEADELPVVSFENALATGKPGFARDVTAILAELRRPELRPLLLQASRHSDPAVRRESIRGLARIPGADSEEAIMASLADSALEVRVAALKAFRGIFSGSSRDRLYGCLRSRNLTGRRNTLVVAAIKALVRLEGREAMPRLRRLARKPLLYRKRRRPVWREAQRALLFLQSATEDRQLDAHQNTPAGGDHERIAA